MIRNVLFFLLGVVAVIATANTTFAQESPVQRLKTWLSLETRPNLEELNWASEALSKEQADEAAELLWTDYVALLKPERKQEWENKLIKLGDKQMKFEFKTFGEPNKSGRSLYISMHGGGGAPARVNEQQWNNQIGLYEPKEGIYLAPRAPTDTWNLWHEAHIDQFFERIIQDAVLFENVDPNRVYIMGYSAGGDGVYQLAPRMADRFAAAAMMAGHPNNSSPLGLRNIGFTLHMGGEDGAYNRNKVAGEWKIKLADLRKADPEGYENEVVIHQGKGHWMDREDAVAVPWMAKFTRNPLPTKVVWFQSGVKHLQFYWLAVDEPNAKGGSEVVASIDGQTINIERTKDVNKLAIRMNDKMLNLNEPIDLQLNGQSTRSGIFIRNIRTLHQTMHERGDRNLMFSAEATLEFSE